MNSVQKSTVEKKYEAIYRLLAAEVADVIATTSAPADIVYAAAKVRVQRAWTGAFKGFWEGYEGNDRAGYLSAYFDTQVSWREYGQTKHGSRMDREASCDRLYAELIRRHAPHACDLVLDLGCGWGHRMVDAFRAGLVASFCGGDRSDYSRQLTQSVAGLFPDMRAAWRPFDFLHPDFDAFPAGQRICLFTCHAIEQVQVLGATLFDKMLARYPDAKIVGVHLEPIAHQIDSSRGGDAAYATKHKYNTDLYAVAANHPRLKITEKVASVVEKEEGNTSALLVWETI